MEAEQAQQFIQPIARGLAHGQRPPVLRQPALLVKDEHVFFPGLDGLPLEGWLMPAAVLVKGTSKSLQAGSEATHEARALLRIERTPVRRCGHARLSDSPRAHDQWVRRESWLS